MASTALPAGAAWKAFSNIVRSASLKYLRNRIDPVESYVNDPWMKLPVGARYYLSKRGKAMVDKRAAGPAERNRSDA